MKQHLIGLAAMSMFLVGMGPAVDTLCAEEVEKPAAKSEEPATEAAAEEPVETLEKKSDKPDAAETKPKPAADKPKSGEQPDAPAKKEDLTDQLLEGLGLKEEAGAAGNPLDAIVERMRDVQQRLQKTETDKQTRELQTQIVKDLDDLIEKLKNQKPPPPNPNQNQPPPPPNGENSPETPPRGGAQPKPQNSQKQRGGSEEKKQSAEQNQQQARKSQQGSAEEKSESKKSRNSDNQQRQTRSAEEEAARQRMAKDVWGHLPAALRQELLNVYSEKYLPKYDEMVRKYYEALAEQNRRSP